MRRPNTSIHNILRLAAAAWGILSLMGCLPAIVAPQPPPANLAPTLVAVGHMPTSAPTPESTAAPAAISTATTVMSNTAHTYQDTIAGFEIDYPAGWYISDVAPVIKVQSHSYAVVLTSWQLSAQGAGGDIPGGRAKVDISVTHTGEQTAEEAAAHQRQEQLGLSDGRTPAKIVSEQVWTLRDGRRAVLWQLDAPMTGNTTLLITVFNGYRVIIQEYGDLSQFDQIARTLRPGPTIPKSEWPR
jgi:hypothetical protein